MPANQKASDEAVISAYRATRNVWAAAKQLGMCGQSVQERLARLGEARSNPMFSEADEARLRVDYTAYVNRGALADLAAAMGRTKQFLCRKARQLGLTNPRRGKFNHPNAMQESSFHIKRRWARRHLTIGGKTKFFRSRWESNYARLLQWRLERGEIRAWEHEPETLWLADGNSYLPDFRVVMADGAVEIHEVKGWLSPKSAEKLATIRARHPEITLRLIDVPAYGALAVEYCHQVPDWDHEGRAVHNRKARRAAALALL